MRFLIFNGIFIELFSFNLRIFIREINRNNFDKTTCCVLIAEREETGGSGQECYPDSFSCSDGFCIPRSAVCDGRADCPHDEDEINCRQGKSVFKIIRNCHIPALSSFI